MNDKLKEKLENLIRKKLNEEVKIIDMKIKKEKEYYKIKLTVKKI